MVVPFFAISLLLVASTLSVFARSVHTPSHFQHLGLAGRVRSVLTSSDTAPEDASSTVPMLQGEELLCNAINGTNFSTGSNTWTALCDTDFTGQDIYPFIRARDYVECMNHCESYNQENNAYICQGFVWAPDRSTLENDCYLKSGLNDPVYPATLHLVGASLWPTPAPTPAKQAVSASTTSPSTISEISSEIPSPQESLSVQDVHAEKQGKIPVVTKSMFLGTSVDENPSQYVSHVPAKPQQLAADVLVAGINVDLITGYPLAADTGSWTSSEVTTNVLSNMKVVPRISRDGGRGGKINGTNFFVFCDTSTYGQEKDPILGYLNGFVSSSIAVDETLNGLNGKPLHLVNSIGQWQDDVGRMRGWVPMTTGEEAFNIAISGQGYRYAVWPNSSPTSLNSTHAVMYAPLVYLEVDMQDQSSPRYTSLGNTLLLISVDPTYGPHADRLYNQFFTRPEVDWGSLGGIRAWSSAGPGSPGGDIYLFGEAEQGILLGKVAAQDFEDRHKYLYWNGNSWSGDMSPPGSSADAFMINQTVASMDIVYSPAHRTFVMIYLTQEVDNTFYYRYLVGKDKSMLNIIPPYEDGGDTNYVENLITNAWSDQKILFTVPTPERGYAYAGGLHSGYFGNDDIANGGYKMLLTWTEHTIVDPDDPASGYAHKAQIVELG